MTAFAVVVSSIGRHDTALAGVPAAIEPMTESFLALAGPVAGPLALAWSIVVNYANFSANLWLTRKLAGALGVAGVPAFAGIGAVLGLGVAWVSYVAGLGDSDIGFAMEALAGAGVAGLYRLLSGAARL
jgi:hypothetical protein